MTTFKMKIHCLLPIQWPLIGIAIVIPGLPAFLGISALNLRTTAFLTIWLLLSISGILRPALVRYFDIWLTSYYSRIYFKFNG